MNDKNLNINTNPRLVNSINLSHEDRRYFKKNGFLKIKGLLTDLATDALRRIAETEVVSANTIGATYGDTFDKLSYGLGVSDQFKEIYTTRQFKKTIGELLGTRVIATECNGFTLTPGKEGFPWHYGSLSFRFVRPEDMAWSVWIPLDPIDPNGQGGGMSYIPEYIASCGLNYQISLLMARSLVSGDKFDDVTQSLNRIFGFEGIFTQDVFEKIRVEDSFDVGDAFVFNKNVWHRSSPLLEGSLKQRVAVNMRFVDWRSRLDLIRYHGEAETGGGLGLGVNFGHQRQTSYGSQFVDINDGDELRESEFCGEII